MCQLFTLVAEETGLADVWGDKTGFVSFSEEVYGSLWESMEVYGSMWKFMGDYTPMWNKHLEHYTPMWNKHESLSWEPMWGFLKGSFSHLFFFQGVSKYPTRSLFSAPPNEYRVVKEIICTLYP